MKTKALLIFENPWFSPVDNPKRASVLPFLQGLERLEDDLSLYYATFYERRGLEKAMGCDLLVTREKRRFIYLGAHGSNRQIGTDTGTIHLTTVSEFINALCHTTKDVEGVILSCCNTGA